MIGYQMFSVIAGRCFMGEIHLLTKLLLSDTGILYVHVVVI